MFPVLFMMQAVAEHADSLYIKGAVVDPIYTRSRCSRGWARACRGRRLGTGVLLAGFVYLQLLLLGRLFESSVLSAGKPAWRELFAQLRPAIRRAQRR
jgi:hypothetical protein